MPKFTKHILVCGNQRPGGHPRECCDPAGAADLQRAFKSQLALCGLQTTVRANESGCLDQCGNGPTVVVYPELESVSTCLGRPKTPDIAAHLSDRLIDEQADS
jgi:(2Fe-2S) ferredoxin